MSIYKGLSKKKNIYGGSFSLTTPAVYSATKSGLIGLSRWISTAYGKYNIRSNILSPGGVFDQQEKKFVKKYSAKVPLNRMAKWSDYDGAILFLSSDASSYDWFKFSNRWWLDSMVDNKVVLITGCSSESVWL